MSTREILDKIERTVAVVATPIAVVVGIWTNFDIAVYTEATAGLVVSICEYIKLFLKEPETK